MTPLPGRPDGAAVDAQGLRTGSAVTTLAWCIAFRRRGTAALGTGAGGETLDVCFRRAEPGHPVRRFHPAWHRQPGATRPQWRRVCARRGGQRPARAGVFAVPRAAASMSQAAERPVPRHILHARRRTMWPSWPTRAGRRPAPVMADGLTLVDKVPQGHKVALRGPGAERAGAALQHSDWAMRSRPSPPAAGCS